MLLYETILTLLKDQNVLDQSILDPLEGNEPSLGDTLSQLIYKLSCTTNQMWYSQEVLYKIRFMNESEFQHVYSDKISELHKILKRACDLNVQRARLMDAIDLKLLEIKRGV